MDIEEVLQKIVKSIISDDKVVITNETHISELGLNSLDFINLIVLIEAELNIEFDDNYLSQEKYSSFFDLISYVKAKVKPN